MITSYAQLMDQARPNTGEVCKACLVCNGIACGGKIPGPGAKGSGRLAIRNYQKWQEIQVNMDTLYESDGSISTQMDLFGQTFALPLLAGPVGAIKVHYGQKYTEPEYNQILVESCANHGIAAMTGDGIDDLIMKTACQSIQNQLGIGIPTVKPWDDKTLQEKAVYIRQSNAFACAMDIDAAGLPFLKNIEPPAGPKSVQQIQQFIDQIQLPFIVKGIMTVSGAKKAIAAGASAILVSNHGGRVLDQCPATAEVLAEIVDAVQGQVKILVDGGIRSGLDLFKALALGADAVVIARPFVTALYGGAQEGIAFYIDKIQAELADTMLMCGAKTISEINRNMIRI